MAEVVARRGRRLSTVLLRAALVVAGLASAGWGATTLPLFWAQSKAERVGFRLIQGEPFKPEALSSLMQTAGFEADASVCRAPANRAQTMILLRLAEGAIAAGQRDKIDDIMGQLYNAARKGLSCAPTDSFLWLLLYWTENARNGFQAKNFELLRASFRFGPNEGWVALGRTRIALSSYSILPQDVAESVVREFARLLDAGFQQETYRILIGPGWPVREALLKGTENVAERERAIFYRFLYQRGYDLEVPGIPRITRDYFR